MDELTESNVLNASNIAQNQSQALIPTDIVHSQNSTHSNNDNIDIDHSYKELNEQNMSNETKTHSVASTMGQTSQAKTIITTNNTSTIVTNTLHSCPVNSSTLPINLSVELRKIQQSAGLITSSSSNSTFISKHIYHSSDKLQTGSSLTARIPAPNVTVIDKNGENIRILKRVPDSNFGSTTQSFENSPLKTSIPHTSWAPSINLISQSTTGSTNTAYDQHIRVLTPVEIMRTLPSLHDHEMTANESTAGSNFSTALCKSRRNTITSSHENSKDTVDSTTIDSSSIQQSQKKLEMTIGSSGGGGDEEMTEIHTNSITVTTKTDEVASPVVSSTQLKTTTDSTSNRNVFSSTLTQQQRKLSHSSACSSTSSNTSNAAALPMVRGDIHIDTVNILDTKPGFFFFFCCCKISIHSLRNQSIQRTKKKPQKQNKMFQFDVMNENLRFLDYLGKV